MEHSNMKYVALGMLLALVGRCEAYSVGPATVNSLVQSTTYDSSPTLPQRTPLPVSATNGVIGAPLHEIVPERGSPLLKSASRRKLLTAYSQTGRRLQQVLSVLSEQNSPYAFWPNVWGFPNVVNTQPTQQAQPPPQQQPAAQAPSTEPQQTMQPAAATAAPPPNSQLQPASQGAVEQHKPQAARSKSAVTQPATPPVASANGQPLPPPSRQRQQRQRHQRPLPQPAGAPAPQLQQPTSATAGPVTQQPAPATPAAVPATPAVPAEEPATAEEPAEPVAVTIVVQGPQPPTTPSSPSNPPPTSPQQSKYCIPATRGMQFNLLAAGDSITQGSVPSKNYNHPYTIKLKELLRKKLGKNADCTDAGLGGGGVFEEGFHDPVKFGPYYSSYLAQVEWNVAVIAIGINDLLRGGFSALEIMDALQPLYEQTLAKGIPVVAIPPFAAPGFVSQSDPKEAERKKLAALITDSASKRQTVTGGQGPQIYVLDLQAGPLDFWKIAESDRSQYLDDGLHMTEMAYDLVGQYVYDAVSALLCSVQNPTITLPDPHSFKP